ncbi:MAG: lytic transglycosylase [Pyrinomonadaceae bacterium]
MTNTPFKHLVAMIAGFVLLCGGATCLRAQKRLPRRSSKIVESPLPKDTPQSTIRAQTGDSLTSIAERANVSSTELARLNGLPLSARLKKGQRIVLPARQSSRQTTAADNRALVIGQRIKFADGSTLNVDEAWKQGEEVWFRRGGVVQSLVREVRAIEPIFAARIPAELAAQGAVRRVEFKAMAEKPIATWIYLTGGARFRVDEVQETSEGIWYSRANLSVFLERERVARIERDLGNSAAPAWRGSDWTSGNPMIDQLIRTNGSRFGVDPYLVFLVIEQESHFRSRAVSPKGARGLMQLMPGTARRFGVRSPFDAQENIRGGTQYLKELMAMFGGRVDLALASYNAGEGAVMKYGRSIPPYRETREYVKRISKRYGLAGREPGQDNDLLAPRR